jgi:hypothetical protein
LIPAAFGHQLRVRIPAEFELAALVFLFASLFLGEVRDYSYGVALPCEFGSFGKSW